MVVDDIHMGRGGNFRGVKGGSRASRDVNFVYAMMRSAALGGERENMRLPRR